MGAEYYIFALFVLGLVSLLLVLFLNGMKKNRKKELKEIDEKEKKVMMLYFEVEDMLDTLKDYMENSQELFNQQMEATKESMENSIKRIETDMQALSTLKDGLALMRDKYAHDTGMDTGEGEEQAPGIDLFAGEEPAVPAPEVETRETRPEVEDVDSMAKRLGISKSEAALMQRVTAYKKAVDN